MKILKTIIMIITIIVENLNENLENHSDYEDTLTDEQKLKLQSWIDSEEDSDIELKRLRLEHDLLFKKIDKKIENKKKFNKYEIINVSYTNRC